MRKEEEKVSKVHKIKSLEEQVEEKRKSAIAQALSIFKTRQSAYRTVFQKGQTPHTKKVLEDLSRFCRGTKSTFKKDAREHALLEGRREVFQRILDYQNMTAEELLKIASNPSGT